MAFVELISLDKCRKDGGTFVPFGERELAVFRFEDPDRVHVTDNSCPHAGGNLAGGEVVGNIITCPWHHWQFDLESGACVHSERARVRCYRAEVRDGFVWVNLPDDSGNACEKRDDRQDLRNHPNPGC